MRAHGCGCAHAANIFIPLNPGGQEIVCFDSEPERQKALDFSIQGLVSFGRSGGIRTRDPLLPKQMRYQAALRSEGC